MEETNTGRDAAIRVEKDGKQVEMGLRERKTVRKTLGVTLQTEEIRMVDDGTHLWSEIRNSKTKDIRVIKSNSPKAGSGDLPAAPFEFDIRTLEGFAKDLDMKVVGEGTIDGQKMYVMEGQHSVKGPEGLVQDENGDLKEIKDVTVFTTKVWIGQDDLFIWRTMDTVRSDKGRTSIFTNEITSVKVDGKIDPKEFEYTPPKGSVVDDKTRGAGTHVAWVAWVFGGCMALAVVGWLVYDRKKRRKTREEMIN